MIWFHDPADVFPGEFYCYALMSKDNNGVVTVHDIVQSKEPVSDEYLQQRKQQLDTSPQSPYNKLILKGENHEQN